MRVILLEAEAGAASWLAERLAEQGFKACQAALRCPQPGSETFSGDAAIIDMGASLQPVCDIVRGLRERGLDRPLLVVSGNGNWRDRVDSLDAGADDYLVKPIRAEEVAARLRAVIRRAIGPCCGERIRAGLFEVDIKARSAWLAGDPLDLTRDEFRLLRLFTMNPGRIHSNEAIRLALYPDGEARSGNAVEVRIARLRRKLGHDRIRTVRGLGYRLVACDQPEP